MGLGESIRRHRPDPAGAAIAVAAPLESVVHAHTMLTSQTVTGVATGVLLLWRRRFPVPAGLGALAVILAGAAVGDPMHWSSNTLILASLLAAWTLGREPPLTVAAPAGAVGLVLVGLNVVLAPAGAHVDTAASIASTAACWSAGVAFRRWNQQARDLASRTVEAQTNAAADARRAVAGERALLARELHDVISHSVTVMTLQAGGARMLLDSDTGRALEATRAVEECGREALGELRRMGDVLPSARAGSREPEPGLGRLEELIARVRAAGLELVVEETGEPVPLSPGLDLTVYRVVQEALTNALRHGSGRAQLSIGYQADGIRVEVSNPAAPSSADGGRGLIGLRERAALYGGSLKADRAGGRFVLSAWLPTPT